MVINQTKEFAKMSVFLDSEKQKFNCAKHGEYRALFNKFANRWTPCEHCTLEAEIKQRIAEDKERLFKVKQRGILKAWGEAAIPPLFQNENKSFQSYKLYNKKQTNVYAKLTDFLVKLPENIKNGISFVFVGNTDTGKTHLAVALAQEALKQEFNARYTTFGKIMLQLKGTFNGNAFDSEEDVVKKYLSLDLLIIDEIPATVTEYELKMFSQLVIDRYHQNKSSIYISNEAENTFLRTHDPVKRRVSREKSEVLAFDWPGFNA